MRLKLFVSHYDDDTVSRENMGIETKVSETPFQEMTFYNVDAVGRFIEDDYDFGTIYSGGMMFITNTPYDMLVKLVDKEKGL